MRLPSRMAVSILLIAFLSAPGVGGSVDREGAEPAAGKERLRIQPGSGSFVMEGGGGYEEKKITVFYHRPDRLGPDSPVMIVIPGAGRNGDDYRDAWEEASENHGVLILSPSYPEKYYPEYWSYNLAGLTREVTLDLGFVIETHPDEWSLDEEMEDLESRIGLHELAEHSGDGLLLVQLLLSSRAGMLKDVEIRGTGSTANRNPERWIFADFDRIFERVRASVGLKRETYDLFGHSAGGQILHRLAIFHPDSRADRIFAANSGWYTLPTFEQEFPYGLKGTGMTERQLEAAFGTELVVFLGEEDDEDETRGSVRRSPGADRQGFHRLERGEHFFRTAKETAKSLGAEFAWRMEIVPGVGHDHERMGEAAARFLYGDGRATERE